MKQLLFFWILTILLMACQHTSEKSKATPSEGAPKKNILAIVAHADDETFFSPLLSKYAAEHDVHLVIVTNGDKGVRDHAAIPAGDTLRKVRLTEATRACECLGIEPPIFLEYGDGRLHEWEPLFSLDNKIDSLFQLYRPDAVITWGPDGGYGHPDHRIVHSIVTEVFQKALPQPESQLFYYGLPQSVLNKMQSFKSPMGDYFKTNTHPTALEYLTYRIPFSEKDLVAGREAFACHASQFTPDEMDDIYRIVAESDSIIYLRPWNGSSEIKYDLFD